MSPHPKKKKKKNQQFIRKGAATWRPTSPNDYVYVSTLSLRST
jgi:hypothetical protein